MKKILSAILCLMLLPLCAFSAQGEAASDYARFLAAIDMDFALKIAVELSENPSYYSSPLGSRNSGSDGEHAAADYLVSVMKELGLTDVEKAAISADKWSNNGSTLQIQGEDALMAVHSYASGKTPEEGITAEIIYAGTGTMADYEGLDPTGKIVLVDVNQREDWWITYPTLEAEHHGAVAIMLANSGGFSEISGDALNMNDFCGPISIPSVSISRNSAEILKAGLAKGPVTGTLIVDNVVEDGGATTYNVIGKIKGKSSDEMIIIGSHYDTHYAGFQDNSCAVAFDLAIAKAMIDMGYTPERDMVFVSHGAEEWGAVNTVFDWSTGAYGMLTQAHPEWVGKTLAFINSELPAYAFGETTRSDTAPELYTFIKNFLEQNIAPDAAKAFPGGVVSDGYQTYTYSDDFSYYSAGIPSVINGFLYNDARDAVWNFYYQYYHTNFDTKDTYNEDVLRFNIGYYGAMAMFLDQTPALDLDYSRQYDRLAASVDTEIIRASGADLDAFQAALAAYGQAAEKAYAAQAALNAAYQNATDSAEKARLWAVAKEANALSLAIFKETQDAFLGLMYERPIVRHEAPQENISLMESCVELLEAGEVKTAADEYTWQVNNINEWYSIFFSPEVTAKFTDMMFGKMSQGNLFWGTDRLVPYVNVEEATRAVWENYDAENPDLSEAIAIYQREIETAKAQLVTDLASETENLIALTARLASLAEVLKGK